MSGSSGDAATPMFASLIETWTLISAALCTRSVRTSSPHSTGRELPLLTCLRLSGRPVLADELASDGSSSEGGCMLLPSADDPSPGGPGGSVSPEDPDGGGTSCS
eukprot:7391558-Prymnesium_polylepis.1